MAVNRRRFLLTCAAAGLGTAAGRVPALAAAPPSRAARYRTLVRSLRAGGDPRFRGADPTLAYRRFAAWYRAQPAATRVHADTLLLGNGASGARAQAAARLALACVGCEPPLAEDERPDLPIPAPR